MSWFYLEYNYIQFYVVFINLVYFQSVIQKRISFTAKELRAKIESMILESENYDAQRDLIIIFLSRVAFYKQRLKRVDVKI